MLLKIILKKYLNKLCLLNNKNKKEKKLILF